ncbi:MAG TPA: efflux RND transporter periplasmic adaptor subunit [Candidatus Binatia bacterium]
MRTRPSRTPQDARRVLVACTLLLTNALVLGACEQRARDERSAARAPASHAADAASTVHDEHTAHDADRHDEHGAAHGAHVDAHVGHAEHASGDVIRVDPGMLRDLRVTTAPVEVRPAGATVTVLGELHVNEDRYAEVGAPIPARVVEVRVAPGARVETGETLIELSSPELGRARADLLAARARAELARKALARLEALAEERIVPARRVQEARAEAEAADAELQAAGAALHALGVDPAQATADPARAAILELRSPIDGVVIERNAMRGQLADPSKPLVRVADLSELWLTAHAFERDAVRIAPGAAAEVGFAALPGREFQGTVTLVGSRVEPESRTIPVRITVANEDGTLRPGMSATARVPLADEMSRVLAVPAAALQRLADGWVVFLPRGEGRFEVRPVGRGRDLGGEVEVVSGLKPDERVVVDGAFLLKAEAEKARGGGDGHDHAH